MTVGLPYTVFNWLNFSMEVSARGDSSCCTMVAGPFPFGEGISMVRISSVNFPAEKAEKYFWWLPSAHWSWSSRDTPNSKAFFPVTTAIGVAVMGLRIMSISSTFKSPNRFPHLASHSRKGVWLIVSQPPAMTVSASLRRMLFAPNPTQVIEEQQARSTVRDRVVPGNPTLKSI